jgi:hypothetical protein
MPLLPPSGRTASTCCTWTSLAANDNAEPDMYSRRYALAPRRPRRRLRPSAPRGGDLWCSVRS